MKKKIAILMALSILFMPQAVSAAENTFTGGGATMVSYQANKETYIEAPHTGIYNSTMTGYLFEFSAAGLLLFLLLYIREKEKEKEEMAVE